MIKKYLIKTEADYERLCYATLKKVFSPTLFPRVVSNYANSKIYDIFAKKLDFECIFEQNSQIFAKKVHLNDFDLGLFFFKKNDLLFLKLYDGTGHIAGSFVTNIFDSLFSLDEEKFKLQKENLERHYYKLNKKRLLVQKK